MDSTLLNTSRMFFVIGVLCVIYEVVSGELLNATWPVLIIMSIYNCAHRILKEVKSHD